MARQASHFADKEERDVEGLAAERGLPQRMVSALYAAAVGELRRATYQSDEDLTRDQAIRDAVRQPMRDPSRTAE